MKVITQYKAADADPGEWHEYPLEGTEGLLPEERPAFQIRRIPDPEGRKIEIEVFGNTTEVRMKKGESRRTLELNKIQEVTHRKAAYALVNSRNWAWCAGDEATAGDWSGRLKVKVTVGEPFDLAGHWNDAVKKEVFAQVWDLALWTVRTANGMSGRLREDAEGKEET